MNKVTIKDAKLAIREGLDKKDISESVWGALGKAAVGIAVASYAKGRGRDQYRDEAFAQSGLVQGDGVQRAWVTPRKERREEQGIVKFRGKQPMVNVTTGRRKGRLVKWDGSWVKS